MHHDILIHREFANPFAAKLVIENDRFFTENSNKPHGNGVIDLENENNDLIDNRQTIFSIGIGKATHAKNQFKVNDIISGECLTVTDPNMEPVEYYKVSKLKVIKKGEQGWTSSPWELAPPQLEVYRERGHRRLAARTYDTKCSSCMWGCRMQVEIIIDN